jgi:hypothetical protein
MKVDMKVEQWAALMVDVMAGKWDASKADLWDGEWVGWMVRKMG